MQVEKLTGRCSHAGEIVKTVGLNEKPGLGPRLQATRYGPREQSQATADGLPANMLLPSSDSSCVTRSVKMRGRRYSEEPRRREPFRAAGLRLADLVTLLCGGGAVCAAVTLSQREANP